MTGGWPGTAAALAAAVLVAWPCAASAQNGRGNAFGLHRTTGGGPSASGAPEIHAEGTGVRVFGSWLDDASILPAGGGYASLSFGYWWMPGYREIDAPVVDSGVALHRRAQVGISVPYFHANEPEGPVAHGIGDLYLSSKIQLRAPSPKRVGFAITPLLEVRNTASATPGTGRVSWALPLNMEVQRGSVRLFGSTGYFSRGALFASGALETAVSERIWLTGSVSHSYSAKRDDLSASLGYGKTHTDVSGSLSVAARPGVMAFASLGRTLSRQDGTRATLVLAGGVSFSFAAW